MKKRLPGMIAALFAFMVLLPATARAANTAYAILYDDGELVFQNGSTAEPGRTVTNTYEVDLTAVYDWDSNYNLTTPWYNERESVCVVNFADKVSPFHTAYWFYYCENLTRIDNIQNLNTTNVTNMRSMFAACGNLEALDVSHFDTSKVTDMSWMFSNCSGLTVLDVSRFDTSNVTDMSGMFWNCSGLTVLDVSGFDTANVTNMYGIFAMCDGLTALDVSHFDTANVTNMHDMFYGCKGLKTLDVSHFNTANVTTMDRMFYVCGELKTLDVSHFDTANVTNMHDMFYGCSGLTELNVSRFNTANVTTMYAMFYNCSSLTTLDVSHFNTVNVTDMSYLFDSCYGLTTLDVSQFDTANVTTMYAMFHNCSGLTALDVSRFDTANVTAMQHMFYNCSGLTTLDVSCFNTANVGNMSQMFEACFKLKTIYASDKFTVSSDCYSVEMFSNCTSLVGGNGSKYDKNYVDKTYARIDTASAPGYFTAKEDIPSPVTQSFDVTRDAYAFGNGMSDFGYTSRGGKDGGAYPIPARSFFAVFGDGVRGKMMYKSKTSAPWAGNCAGMSASAALLFAYGRLNPSDFGKTDAWSLAIGDENAEMSVLTLVEVMQVAQYTDAFGQARQERQILSGQSLNGLYQAVKDGAEQGRPTLLAIVKEKVGGHALLAIGADGDGNRILVYDCNHPGELQYVTLSDNRTAWSYDMGGYGVWGGGDCSISYVPYDVLEDIWTRRGALSQNTQVLTVNAENLSITNFDGETVASLENGRLVSSAEGVYELVDLSMYWPEERSICLPRNEVYTVAAADDITLNASMTDWHMSAEISTSAKTVTFGVNDDEMENSIVIEGASASDTYSISLESDFAESSYQNVTFSGTGRGEDVSVSMNQDKAPVFQNCNITSLSLDGKSMIYGIGAAAPDTDGNLSVTLTNPAAATLAVAYFDGAGKFVSANLRGVKADVGTAVVSIPANAKTARVTLFDNACRPLCEPYRATVG